MKKNVRNKIKKIIMTAGMMCMLLNAVGVSSNVEIGVLGGYERDYNEAN